jgi:hypothetical protein
MTLKMTVEECLIRSLDLARKNYLKSFWYIDQPLVLWYRWENLESIFFELRIIILPRISKKISKKNSSFCMLLPTFGTLANP